MHRPLSFAEGGSRYLLRSLAGLEAGSRRSGGMPPWVNLRKTWISLGKTKLGFEGFSGSFFFYQGVLLRLAVQFGHRTVVEGLTDNGSTGTTSQAGIQ